MNTIKIDELNLNELDFVKPPKTNLATKGSTVIYVNKRGCKQQLLMQFPMMFSWGAAQALLTPTDNETQPDKFALSIQFPAFESFTDVDRKCFDKIVELEELIVKEAVSRSVGWFGKARKLDSILDNFGGILKYPKDKTTNQPDKSRPPSIKIKLSKYESKFQFSLYDTDKNLLYSPTDPATSSIDIIKENLIPSKSNVKCLVSLSLWVVGSNLYPVFTLKQIMCKNPEVSAFNYNNCIVDESSSEQTTLKETYDVPDSESETEAEEFNIPAPKEKPIVNMPLPVPEITEKPTENPNKIVEPEPEPEPDQDIDAAPIVKKTKKTKGIPKQ